MYIYVDFCTLYRYVIIIIIIVSLLNAWHCKFQPADYLYSSIVFLYLNLSASRLLYYNAGLILDI